MRISDWSSDVCSSDLAAQLTKTTRVVSSTDSDFIDITVQSRKAELAARIANRFVDSLQKMRSQRRQTWRNGLSTALDKETKRLAHEVELAERAVADFRRQPLMPMEIGRASCRERVCQYV